MLPHPPGPRGHRWSGSLPEYRRDTLGFLVESARDYGDVVSYRLGHQNACLINDPALIEKVLVTDFRLLPKGLTSDPGGVLQTLVGASMLTNDGAPWIQHRRLAQPSFSRDRIPDYAGRIVARGEGLLSTWKDGETRDVHRDMIHLAVAIIGDVFFGTDLSDVLEEIGGTVEIAMEEHVARIRRPVWLPERVPTPGKLRFRAAMRRFNEIIAGIIHGRRADGGRGADVVSRWLAYRDPEGRPATDTQIRDEIATLLLAGHDTTALTLSWTWHRLAENPRSEARLVEELDRELDGRGPRLEDLRRLRYLDCVLQETLRLYPSAWGFTRICLDDYEIGGYRIPARTSILMSPWVTQRDPRFFDDPEAFRPERWEDGLGKRLPNFAYFPFGGGPRSCIGANFGMMEAALLLATLVRRFHCEPAPGYRAVPWPAITVRPRHGLTMTLRKR